MDRIPHRRAHPRLCLGIAAELIGLSGTQRVILQDLSATGAKVQLQSPKAISKGVLRWLNFEVFGDIAWQQDDWCGLNFDRPLSNGCLFDTRAAAPGLLAIARRNRFRHAEDFVKGRGRV